MRAQVLGYCLSKATRIVCFAAALTAMKLGLSVAQIEAGLRSYDWRMPEEHNRRMVDHVSDILFTPTAVSKQNLINEQVHGKILVTGNTLVDAVNHYRPVAVRRSDILKRIRFSEFCFVTVHRKENVDSRRVLRSLVEALTEVGTPAVFPVHPYTNLRLREAGLCGKLHSSPNMLLIPPIGHLDTLGLLRNCKFILTDSGGLQEEATIPSIRKPLILLRTSTESPEVVDAGFVRVAGVSKKGALNAIEALCEKPPSLPKRSPFGDGKAAERIVSAIISDTTGDLD